MEITRRNFIKSLFALAAVTTAPTALRVLADDHLSAPQQKTCRAPELWRDQNLLVASFFPMLQMNEKEVLYFYRDKKKKITVGYGTNVQANPDLLSLVTIYHKDKKLSAAEKKNFIDTMASKSDSSLSDYHITRNDARTLATTSMNNFINKLAAVFVHPSTNSTFFFDLPLCMQALSLDIMYNVGVSGFLKYVKFKSAMTKHDYDWATQEATVYTDIKEKTTNKPRERRKKRLIRVMKIAQDNCNKPLHHLSSLIKSDYKQQVPYRIQLIYGTQEQKCELRLAVGELNHIRLLQRRMQMQVESPSLTPPVQKTHSLPLQIPSKEI